MRHSKAPETDLIKQIDQRGEFGVTFNNGSGNSIKSTASSEIIAWWCMVFSKPREVVKVTSFYFFKPYAVLVQRL